MPVYQGGDYLDFALKSIADQGDPDVEIVLVDDGSTDDTLAIANRWRGVIDINIHQENHGGNWVRNTNLGLKYARAPWISLLHQDDIWSVNRLSVLRTFAAQTNDIDFFLHPAYFIDQNGNIVGRWRCPLPSHCLLDTNTVLPKLAKQNFIPIVSPLVRRKCIVDIGEMDENLWYFADWEYWVRLAGICNIYYIPRYLAAFRIHSRSQTSQRTKNFSDVENQFNAVIDRVLTTHSLSEKNKTHIRKISYFSKSFYLFLLAGMHGRLYRIGLVICEAIKIGPVELIQYFRHARVFERLLPRLRFFFKSKFNF